MAASLLQRWCRAKRPERLLAGALALGLAMLCQPAVADVPETDLKAQIIVRALLFAQWPAASLPEGQALVLCLPEGHALGEALARQDGQMVNGHRLQVRRTSVDPAKQCHVALMPPSDGVPMALRRPGLLRVGDLAGGLKEGATLNVQIELGRVVFDINLKAARDDGLDIDTRLLRLARYVQRD